MDWFRWHHGTVNDPKWRVVSRRAGVTLRDVLAVWATMLECASQAADRGSIESWRAEDIAAGFDMEVEQVTAIYDAMQGKTLDGNRIAAWEKRQPKREDSTATDRKRRQRARHDVGAGDTSQAGIVTHDHAASRNVTQCHDRGEEIREDNTDSSLRSESGAGQPAFNLAVQDSDAPELDRPRTKRGSRLAGDATLPEKWALWARSEGHPDPEAEWVRFRDYWAAVPGKDGVKLDWEATWRNRVRDRVATGRCATGGPKAPAVDDAGRPVLDASLEPYRDRLEEQFTPEALRSWFGKLHLNSADDRPILTAPSKFMADYLVQQFESRLRLIFGQAVRIGHGGAA